MHTLIEKLLFSQPLSQDSDSQLDAQELEERIMDLQEQLDDTGRKLKAMFKTVVKCSNI